VKVEVECSILIRFCH